MKGKKWFEAQCTSPVSFFTHTGIISFHLTWLCPKEDWFKKSLEAQGVADEIESLIYTAINK